MRRRWPVIAACGAMLAGIALAPISAPVAQTTGRVMVDYRQTNQLRVGQWWHLFRYPDGTYHSHTYATLAVGPLDLQAGDVLDVRLEHEFDNETNVLLMASTSVYLGTSGQMGGPGNPQEGQDNGSGLILGHATNWTGMTGTHHLPVDRTGLVRVGKDCSDCYVYDLTRFAGDDPGMVQVNPAPYARLTAAVYR